MLILDITSTCGVPSITNTSKMVFLVLNTPPKPLPYQSLPDDGGEEDVDDGIAPPLTSVPYSLGQQGGIKRNNTTVSSLINTQHMREGHSTQSCLSLSAIYIHSGASSDNFSDNFSPNGV